MTQRLDWKAVAPEAYQAMSGLEKYAGAHVEPRLYELVKMRASFLNGCAFCLDMHAHDALKKGEALQRLFLVAAWHEAREHFTPQECAALALTDAVTRIGGHGVQDEVWQEASKHFTERELVDLTAAVVTINGWNRFVITMATPVAPRA